MPDVVSGALDSGAGVGSVDGCDAQPAKARAAAAMTVTKVIRCVFMASLHNLRIIIRFYLP